MSSSPGKNSNGKTRKSQGIGVWIQNDQLSLDSALMAGIKPGVHPICLIESVPTLTRFRYHKKRLALELSLVRHYAAELREAGYEVVHYQLGDPVMDVLCEAGEEACLKDFVKRTGVTHLRVMEAAEYDSQQIVLGLAKAVSIPVEIVRNDQFLVSRYEFAEWFESAPEATMDAYYRKRRRETGLLMDEDQPLGGRWNFDADNRVPPAGNMPIPPDLVFPSDEITRGAVDIVNQRFESNIGEVEDLTLPVTRKQALVWLEEFLTVRLRLFGMYQDAMMAKSNRCYHSLLSPYLNHGLLRVEEILKAVDKAYVAEDVPINSAEGFIRQILGWREFLHGFYWLKMPAYRDVNFFDYHQKVPELLSTGETNLKCIKCVVDQSRHEGYAHHIQRLMVIGNFALLIGVEPKDLVKWMMEMFIDAVEWAAIPNVMGMTLYADGGQLGSKPYAASAHYIDKMSDYCHGCHYREHKRIGEKACPLNFLYWNFVGKFQDHLKSNPRMQTAIQMYRLKPAAERALITSSAQTFIERIELEGTDRRVKRLVH
jgi:deoxyribodipyrimidine photolyase-related protein